MQFSFLLFLRTGLNSWSVIQEHLERVRVRKLVAFSVRIVKVAGEMGERGSMERVLLTERKVLVMLYMALLVLRREIL